MKLPQYVNLCFAVVFSVALRRYRCRCGDVSLRSSRPIEWSRASLHVLAPFEVCNTQYRIVCHTRLFHDISAKYLDTIQKFNLA